MIGAFAQTKIAPEKLWELSNTWDANFSNRRNMNENDPEIIDDLMKAVLKLRIKFAGIKAALKEHRQKIKDSKDHNPLRNQADEKIWEILDYDEFFN